MPKVLEVFWNVQSCKTLVFSSTQACFWLTLQNRRTNLISGRTMKGLFLQQPIWSIFAHDQINCCFCKMGSRHFWSLQREFLQHNTVISVFSYLQWDLIGQVITCMVTLLPFDILPSERFPTDNPLTDFYFICRSKFQKFFSNSNNWRSSSSSAKLLFYAPWHCLAHFWTRRTTRRRRRWPAPTSGASTSRRRS